MSERKVDVNATSSESASGKITKEEIESREQKKARRAEVLDRGMIGSRLQVKLPDDRYGEWVPKDDVFRKQALGFEIEKNYKPDHRVHDQGDGATYVGDVVFMTCSKEDKEILDEIRQERYDRLHKPKGGKQIEEREYINSVDKDIPPDAASNVRQARKEDISAAITAAGNQNLR